MMALMRRAQTGGSWHVRVSLAQTAHWLWRLGEVPGDLAHPDLSFDDVGDLLESYDTVDGRVSAVRPAQRLALTPASWPMPPSPFSPDVTAWA